MLFETLGAFPTGKLEGWDYATISCVSLSIDDVQYRVVRQGDRRAMFDSQGNLLTITSRSRSWVDTWNALTGFNLVLSDKNEKTTPADPACFFLPFYINQDGSWGAGWSTFKFLSRFKSPLQPILEYFSQITPPEFYRAKSAKDALATDLSDNDRELNALRKAKSRVSKALPQVGPQISSADFELEIARLTREINSLSQRQEELRLTAIRQNEALAMVRREIIAAQLTLAEYREDVHYLDRRGLEGIVCPTCGAEHTDTFLGTLEYAEDARALEATILRLKANEEKLLAEVENAQATRNGLETNYRDLDGLLQTKKGEMQFGEIVQSLGASSALDAFETQEQGLEQKSKQLLSEIHRLELEMKSFIDKKRRKQIRDDFRAAYNSARILLNLPPADVSKQQMYTRPDLSGSGGPRAILAYYAAIWGVCGPHGREGFDPPSIPLVIDCPNQQGQDAKNLPAIVSFLATQLPKQAQVIVTFEGEVADKFDRKIELLEPHRLLQENEFDLVSHDLDGLLTKMNEDLLKPTADPAS